MRIELTVDQVDEVLIDELKRTYTDAIATPKQLKAIRRVLKYYMVPADYEAFMNPPNLAPLASGRSFQVGDVVRVVKSIGSSQVGDILTVTEDDGEAEHNAPFWCAYTGGVECFLPERLELIRRAA